ncbi:MAG: DsbA family protein [Paracoccaceae bacterium]
MKLTRRKTMAVMAAAGAAAMMGLPALAQTATATPAAAPEIQDFGLGPVDAKVTVIEYASFTCPHCAHFHAEVWPKLKADYIDTGKIRFVLREVYFDRFGLWGAMVARCGGEMRYFGITDILFDTQQEWAASEDPNQTVANLKKIGRSAGMDDATLDACLKDAGMAESLVAHFQKNAEADNLQGTPSFVINGTMHSNMSYDDMKKILDAELAK